MCSLRSVVHLQPMQLSLRHTATNVAMVVINDVLLLALITPKSNGGPPLLDIWIVVGLAHPPSVSS